MLQEKNQLMRRYFLVITTIFALLVGGFFLEKREHQGTDTLVGFSIAQEKSPNSSNRGNNETRMAEVRLFLKEFLEKYLQYHSKKPTAHVESIKLFVIPEIYEREKMVYREPLSEIKSRKLSSIRKFKAEEKNKYTILAKVEIVTDSGTMNEDVLYTFGLAPKGSRWKIKVMEYVSFNDF